MRRIAVLLAIAAALTYGIAYAATDHSTLIKGPFKRVGRGQYTAK